MNKAELNKIHTKIFEAATDILSILGPGMPACIYRSAILHELRLKGLLVKKDIPFSVIYKDYKTGEINIDLLIENSIMLDIIDNTEISLLNIAQMQSKLKITQLRMGIVVTFNTLNIIDGYRKVLAN